jgi:hypothetical protein
MYILGAQCKPLHPMKERRRFKGDGGLIPVRKRGVDQSFGVMLERSTAGWAAEV